MQELSPTKSAPVKTCISTTVIVHVGDKAPVILRFYAKVAIAAAKDTAAFRSSDNTI